MKVLQLDTERGWRGGEQQVLSMCRGLTAIGHESFVAGRPDGLLRERLQENHIQFFPISPWSEWAPVTVARLRAELLRRNIDVVHAHSAHAVALAATATLGTSVPVVATRRVDFHFSRSPFTRWKYSRVDRFIAVSRRVKEVMIEDGVSDDRISVIADAIDFDRFSRLNPVTKASLEFPSDSILVGCIAALVPHKDPATFIRAVGLLHKRDPRVRGIVFGEGELRPGLEAIIRELHLEGIVRLGGFRKDILNCLAAFDVFCLTSVEEGLGTSLLDAMALRIPVVATDAGGIPDIVKHESTGLLAEARSWSSVADAVRRVLTDKMLRDGLVDRAQASCRNFDVLGSAKRIADVYSSAIESRSTSL